MISAAVIAFRASCLFAKTSTGTRASSLLAHQRLERLGALVGAPLVGRVDHVHDGLRVRGE